MGLASRGGCWKQAPLFQVHTLILGPIGCESLAFRNSVPLGRLSLLTKMFLCVGENKPTCGVESMSRLQEHILPSVETVMRLWAFWVPTTFTQYTGCCRNINMEDQTLIREEMLTSECQTRYSKTRIKEWHNPTIIQASGHLPLLIWTWFLFKSSGSNTS